MSVRFSTRVGVGQASLETAETAVVYGDVSCGSAAGFWPHFWGDGGRMGLAVLVGGVESAGGGRWDESIRGGWGQSHSKHP